MSASIGLATVVVEYFGIQPNLGAVIAFASALTALVALAASTFADVQRVEFSVDGIATRVDDLRDQLHGLRWVLEDIRGILLDRLPPR